jgi:hypothetical protein
MTIRHAHMVTDHLHAAMRTFGTKHGTAGAGDPRPAAATST